MLKECKFCWKEFSTNMSRIKYCSAGCYNKDRIKHKDKKCLKCWKTFHPLNWHQLYCSKKCSLEWMWYDCVCVVCSKVFKWKRVYSKYCSEKCKKQWQRELNDISICENCWEKFYPWHKWWKYCSDKCKRSVRKTIKERECPICMTIFKPTRDSKIYCSKECYTIAQKETWINLTEEEKSNVISNLQTNSDNKISKINKRYKAKIEKEWYNVELEYKIKSWWTVYYYDLKVWNHLIEINPWVYHNSTWSPKNKEITEYYHYNKVKCAIEHWYNIIMVRDWMNFKDVVDIINTLQSTTQLDTPTLHRYQPKTKEHIIDKWQNRDNMIESWFVEIYDAWEKYIFNSTTIN